MQNFNLGDHVNIGHSININNSFNQTPKLLEQCTNEELYAERKHRKKLLKNELNKKGKIFLILVSIAVLLGVCIHIYYRFGGDTNLTIVLVIISGIVLPIITAHQSTSQPTEFETRQKKALQEIDYILREREQL